jgi:twinkle protein
LDNGDKRYDYEKGGQNWIYNEEGIDYARKSGGVVIVEGEFDCMSVWQSGIKNVVSPASGKDSYGVWIEQLDTIPKVLIAYDNDEAGKDTAIKMAERLGTAKCFEITYPENVGDANDYFKKYNIENFRELAKKASPFYKYEFKGIADIIDSLRKKQDETIILNCVPSVKFEKDCLAVVSGVTNVGKSSYVMNMADELTRKGIPTLFLPFERGIEALGKRFLQVKFNKTMEEFAHIETKEWDDIVKECIETPIYFAMPKRGDIIPTIIKSKRLFDTRVVIVDHLDYMIRNVSGNKEAEIANTLQALKRVAEENKIIMIIVTHIRKVDSGRGMLKRDPTMEDLKGSSSLSQDPEVVIMLTKPDEGIMRVAVLKNKGEMETKDYLFNFRSGKLGGGEWDLPKVELPKLYAEGKEIINTTKDGKLERDGAKF